MRSRVVTTGVAALLLACGGDGPNEPEPGPPASLTKAPTTDNQSAPVGTAVALPPAVVVKDARGTRVPNATVVFAVASGAGSLTGATATTDANGVASVGSWTLGTTAGANTLTASVTGLSAETFTATGTAGAPTTMVKLAGDAQAAKAGTTVPTSPAVRVTDQYGNRVPGAPVTFAIVAGGGTVTGGTAVTNSKGEAAVGSWRLGTAFGENRLRASTAGSGPAEVFTATSLDPCTTVADLPVGSAISESLSTTDCDSGGLYTDFFNTTLNAAAALRITMESGAVDSYLEVYNSQGDLIAQNDDEVFGSSLDAAIKLLAGADDLLTAASSFNFGQTGPYTVRVQPTSSDIAGCEEVWAMKGISADQTIQSTDCLDSSGPFYSDEVALVLFAGQTVTITMRSTAVDAYLILYDGLGDVVDFDDDSAGGRNARITFTASSSDLYVIDFGTSLAGQTGAYTLTIQ